jgi:hypothetical protein
LFSLFLLAGCRDSTNDLAIIALDQKQEILLEKNLAKAKFTASSFVALGS